MKTKTPRLMWNNFMYTIGFELKIRVLYLSNLYPFFYVGFGLDVLSSSPSASAAIGSLSIAAAVSFSSNPSPPAAAYLRRPRRSLAGARALRFPRGENKGYGFGFGLLRKCSTRLSN